MGVGEELPPRCDKWSAQARFTEIKKKMGPTLFFFDDCDRIVDSPEFETLVRSLLDECKDTKVLLTCRADNFATEHSIELTGISKNEAWQLFCKHAGPISELEKSELLRENPDDELFKRHENKEEVYDEKYLAEHGLMKVLS